MNKNFRFYFTPILATAAAVIFWATYREDKGFWWWIILIAIIALGHCIAYPFFKKGK